MLKQIYTIKDKGEGVLMEATKRKKYEKIRNINENIVGLKLKLLKNKIFWLK